MTASDDRKRQQMGGSARVWSCEGKVGLDSYAQAAEILARNRTKPRPGRSAYHCSFCGKYHLGSDKGRSEAQRSNELKERKRHDATSE